MKTQKTTSEQQIKVVKINTIVEVENYKNFYQSTSKESNEQLKQSLISSGQLVPLVVTNDNVLLDGYRRLMLLTNIGEKTVKVIYTNSTNSIESRITLNLYREKTETDLTNEVISVFEFTPKRQGVRVEGETYNRSEILTEKLGYRWKSPETLRQLENVIENDFDNKVLTTGIVVKGWSVSDCDKYVNEYKDVDVKNKYGFTKKLIKGELNINQTNKFIVEKEFLSNEYEDTFVIPDRCSLYKMSCTDINELSKFQGKVNTVFTSIPYWNLRFYENDEDHNQLGHEKTPEEFVENISKIFSQLEDTLNETSSVMINVGDTYIDGCGVGIPRLLTNSILRNTNLKFLDQIVWSKPNPKPQRENVRRPINKVEYILWFVVDVKKYKYKLLKYTDTPKDVKVTNGAKDVDENGTVWKKVKSLTKPYKKIYNHLEEQEVEHMIRCATGKNKPAYDAFPTGHPALMAELLPVVPILMTSDEGDLIFDPFGGANTTGRISNLLNRRYLSTELSTHYHRVGCKVMENTQGEINLGDLQVITEEFVQKETLTEAA